MESIKEHPLLRITQEEFHKVRQFYDIDNVDKVKESIKMIREWCDKQDHLKGPYEYLSDQILERLFLISRGSVEKTKTKIDKLCTARGLVPELCLNRQIKEFKKIEKCVQLVTLPYLNPMDQSRVIVIRMLATDVGNFDITLMFRYMLMMGDYRLHYDYNISDRFIFDIEQLSTSYLTKLNPVVIRKAQTLWTEGYGVKINGIHIVNVSPIVNKVVFLLKQSLKEKVANRLYVHKSYEDLSTHIPKEVLPKDLGGDLPLLTSISEKWDDLFNTEEAKQIVQGADKLVSDETKRSSSKFNEEYLGMPGSFRQLKVD